MAGLFTSIVTGTKSFGTDLGLLALRLFFGLSMAIAHGWGKLENFGKISESFPSAFGLGSATSLGLAVFSEFFCAIALALGLLSRLSLIPLIITMAVAAFDIHGADPYSKMEKALMYLVVYAFLFLSGPGKISLDRLLKKS